MNKAMALKGALSYLFRSGANSTQSAEEMQSLLGCIDYHLLLQSLLDDCETVYQYSADGASENDFIYRGPELLSRNAVLLYTDLTEFAAESCLCTRALELWLMTNMRFAVTSCYSVSMAGQRYLTEYRTF